MFQVAPYPVWFPVLGGGQLSLIDRPSRPHLITVMIIHSELTIGNKLPSGFLHRSGTVGTNRSTTPVQFV